MTIWTIIFVACGVVSGNCKAVYLPAYDLSALPTPRYMEAQGVVANWVSMHPGWTVDPQSILIRRGQGT